MRNRAPPKDIQLEFIHVSDLLKMDLPPAEDLVVGLIRAQSVNLLVGETGSGKSMLALNLALAVSTGSESWIGYEVIGEGKVLYLNSEMALPDIRRRLEKMLRALPVGTDISTLSIPRELPLLRDCIKAIMRECETGGYVLIIADCLYFMHDEDENDSSSMRDLMRLFLVLRDKFNLAVVVVHHLRKGGDGSRSQMNQIRGSSVFSAVMDTVIQLKYHPDDKTKRILVPVKFRHLPDSQKEGVVIALDEDTDTFRREGKIAFGNPGITAEQERAKDVIIFADVFRGREEMSSSEIVEACKPYGFSDRTIRREIKSAWKGGILDKAAHGRYRIRHMDNGQSPTE